ncbi:MAG: carboxypeptidase-like regulatory domain-containing protein [Terracidiphilus sp.]
MSLFDHVQRISWSLPGAHGSSGKCKEWVAPSDLSTNRLRRLRFLALAAVVSGPLVLAGQQAPAVANDRELPNAPGAAAAFLAPDRGTPVGMASAAISGTVLDANGSEVQDAHVVLNSLAGSEIRSEQSGSNGEFTFTGLPPGDFKLTVSGQGWGTFVSPEIQLHPGDFHFVPNVVLPLTASATVRVVANSDELAEEQVHIAEQQRVLGVLPNFYSSYDWNAPPMGSKQKFQLVFRSLSDPMTFVGAASIAGIEQQANVFSGYGTGAQGYAKRFGAAYADDFTADTLAHAVYPSLFHQDPRYFYRGSGSIGSRALYAISAAVRTRGDNGRWEPNYSYILGSFTAGGISNLYYPAADRGAMLTVVNGLVDIAEHAGTNLVREFVLKRFTSRASVGVAGRP